MNRTIMLFLLAGLLLFVAAWIDTDCFLKDLKKRKPKFDSFRQTFEYGGDLPIRKGPWR